jgi:hypothetical protein
MNTVAGSARYVSPTDYGASTAGGSSHAGVPAGNTGR